MQAVLRVISGSEFGRVVQLDGSHSVLIGRSDEADIAVTSDALMSSRHCRITPSADGFMLEDLNSTNGTFVNGGQVSRRLLRDSDSIRCGDTEFMIAVDENSPAPASRATSASSPPTTPAATATPAAAEPHDHPHPHPHPVPDPPVPIPFSVEDLGPEKGYINPSAMAIVERFELAEDLEAPPAEAESVDEYIDRLVGEENYTEAMKFLAYALPKRCAVWWGQACVSLEPGRNPAAGEMEALNAARIWVKDPSENLRQKIWQHVQTLKKTAPAAWVGTGVAWSHGSLAPPENPPVPPPPKLTGVAISSAVLLASFLNEPENAIMKQRRFIGMARELATRDKPWMG